MRGGGAEHVEDPVETMLALEHKQARVIGLGGRGRAACEFLPRSGAKVMGERIRAAWSLFTPCTVASSLVEPVAEAAKNATFGDVVLLSPACSSFDQFRNYQHRGEVFCQAVKSIGWGVHGGTPNIHGNIP